MACQSPSG